MRCFYTTTIWLLGVYQAIFSQKINPDDIWPAYWIADKQGPKKEFAVYHFWNKEEYELKSGNYSIIIK